MGILDRIEPILARRPVALSVIAATIGLTVTFDLLLPHGVAAGLAYLLVVVAFYLMPGKSAYIAGAVVASVCVFAGYLLSPGAWSRDDVVVLEKEVILINRIIALTAIWGLALALFRKRTWKANAGHEHLIADEMGHRLRNIFGQVQAVIRTTKKTAPSPQVASDLILSRVEALSKTCGILVNERWEHAPLRSVVVAELAPHGENRFRITGNDVCLTPKAGFLIALVVHELATNAAKYGALSVPGGCVKVNWYIPQDVDELVFEWKETDGPAVTPPKRTGFGTTMIERAMRYDLGATPQLAYVPDGVFCRIELPLDHVVGAPPPLLHCTSSDLFRMNAALRDL